MEKQSGLLIVITGPSGVGKGTIIEGLLQDAKLNLSLSVSATTRKQRKHEIDGVNYFFKTKQQFEQMIANHELLEYATYVNNYYGTPIDHVDQMLKKKKNVLLEIEYQGALQVISKAPEVLSIFVSPPSLDELKQRLLYRGTENQLAISERLKQAAVELQQIPLFKYHVVNDNVTNAIEQIRQIILTAINYEK